MLVAENNNVFDHVSGADLLPIFDWLVKNKWGLEAKGGPAAAPPVTPKTRVPAPQNGATGGPAPPVVPAPHVGKAKGGPAAAPPVAPKARAPQDGKAKVPVPPAPAPQGNKAKSGPAAPPAVPVPLAPQGGRARGASERERVEGGLVP